MTKEEQKKKISESMTTMRDKLYRDLDCTAPEDVEAKFYKIEKRLREAFGLGYKSALEDVASGEDSKG